MRTDLGKRTHQCDEAQGNNSTRALSTKIVHAGYDVYEYLGGGGWGCTNTERLRVSTES